MKMKKIFIIIAAALVSMTACVDVDLVPLSSPSSEQWYSSKEEIQLAVNSLYAPSMMLPQSMTSEGLRWGDDLNNRANLVEVWSGAMTSESSMVATIWQNLYKGISRANKILNNTTDASSMQNVTSADIDTWRGEAYCYLGIAYGWLNFLWGDVVLDKSGMSVEEMKSASRSPKAEVLKYCYECFDNAASLLPLSSGDVKRFTKGVALGYKARMALWNNDYPVVESAAKALMDLNAYKLYPTYGEQFTQAWSSELIWGIHGDVPLGIFYFFGSPDYNSNVVKHMIGRRQGGWGSYTPSYELLCAYTCIDGKPIDESPLYNPKDYFENRDPRMAQTIAPFATAYNKKVLDGTYDPNEYVLLDYEVNPGPTIYEVYQASTGKKVSNTDSKARAEHATYNGLRWKKFLDESFLENNLLGSPVTYPDLRYADVLLMYAEAMIEQGKCTQDVLDATINAIRERGYAGSGIPYPKVEMGTQAQLRTILRTERYIELAAEGHRYQDVMRWKIANKVFNTPMYYLNRAWSGSTSWKGNLSSVSETYRQMCKNWEDGNYPIGGIPDIDENGFADLKPQVEKGYIVVGSQRIFNPDRDYLWPIPAGDRLVNPNLTQNPNW